MTLPKPERGLVISYAYLWHSEYEKGRAEGVKDRPCVIIVAIQDNNGTPMVDREIAKGALDDPAVKRLLTITGINLTMATVRFRPANNPKSEPAGSRLDSRSARAVKIMTHQVRKMLPANQMNEYRTRVVATEARPCGHTENQKLECQLF